MGMTHQLERTNARLALVFLLLVLSMLLNACSASAPPPANSRQPASTSTAATAPQPTAPESVAATSAPAASAVKAATSAPTPTPAPAPAQPKIQVVATFSILGDWVSNVAGDVAEVQVLVGPNADVHAYEPTPLDNVKLANANVLIENGLGFESWLDGIYAASGSQAVRVAASDGVALLKANEATGENDGQNRAEFDPHVWQDVGNAIKMVQNIEAALSKADPVNADTYKTNAARYVADLLALEQEIGNTVDNLARDARLIVTSHDTLAYFAQRYGFKVIGSVFNALSTANEPSAHDLANLVDNIRTSGTKAIFLESISNPKVVERVAQEAGVEIGPALYTDALGEPNSEGATYIQAMRYNTRAIVDALR
jgi:ABC-type Zn uptake system ZnuABC Zn-binding protein ZnuA